MKKRPDCACTFSPNPFMSPMCLEEHKEHHQEYSWLSQPLLKMWSTDGQSLFLSVFIGAGQVPALLKDWCHFFFKPFRIVQKFGSEFRASSGWGRRKQTAREWKMISETEFWSCELLQENFTWLNPISRGLNITICFKLATRAVYGNWVWGATGLFEAHLQGEKLIIRALKRESIWNLHWHRQMRLFSFRTQRCISSIHLCWFG